MQNIADLIYSLRAKHVELWADNGGLNYRAPKGILVSEEIALLREQKQQVLEFLSGEQATHGESSHNPHFSDELAPLTLHQEFFWKRASQHGELNLNVVTVSRIRGELDLDALERSLQTLVQRHAALRIQIAIKDGVPKQRICDKPVFTLEVVDICGLNEDDTDTVVQRHISEFSRRKIDLSAESLFNAKLLKLVNEDYLLALSVHHIVADATSIKIIDRDLWHIYGDLINGQQCSLPPLPMEYTDYARQQRRAYSNWSKIHKDFWEKRLAGALQIRLPHDDGLKHIPSSSPARKTFSFDKTLSSALRQLARNERCLLPILMLAAYSALLWRWCEQKSFVIPFNYFGRDRREYEEIVGVFVYPLLLRLELTGNETFGELLEMTSKEFMLALKHRDFGNWVNEAPQLLDGFIQWIASGSGDAQDDMGAKRRGIRFQLEKFPINIGFSKNEKFLSDISVGLFDIGSEVLGRVTYRADHFKPDTIERLCGEFREICIQMVRNPMDAISSYGDRTLRR